MFDAEQKAQNTHGGGASPYPVSSPDVNRRFTHRSEQIEKLAMALAKAQGDFPLIPRERTVSVRMESGNTYTFSYAPLETLIACTRPHLAKHGIAVVQDRDATDRGTTVVRTTLLHESGQWMTSHGTPVLVTKAGPQADGSALTYAKRYDYSTTLMLAADEDDDANAAEGNSASKQERPKPSATYHTITAEQATSIVEAIVRADLSEKAFLKKYAIGKIAALPSGLYDIALKEIADYASKKAEKKPSSKDEA